MRSTCLSVLICGALALVPLSVQATMSGGGGASYGGLSGLFNGLGQRSQNSGAEASETAGLQRQGGRFVERVEKMVGVSEGGLLELYTPRGRLEVESWERDAVKIEVDKIARVFTEQEASALFARFQVRIEESKGLVRVRAEGGEDLSGLEALFRVWVPRKYSVDLETSGGGIQVGDLHGSVGARTSGGGIEVGRIQGGPVAIRSSGGGLEIEAVTGDVRAHTAGGGISIGQVSGDLEARTAGGGIEVDSVGGQAMVKTAGGGISIGEGGRALSAETAGGGIEVGGASGSVQVKTAGGSIEIGPVKGEVRAETAGGSIEVERAGAGVYVKTAGGSVEVAEAGGPVQAHTSGGSIEIGGARGFIEAETAGGGISAALLTDDPDTDTHCILETAGGDVEIYLPEKLRATVDAELRIEGWARREYRIYSDFDLKIEGEGTKQISGRGALNGGGDLILLRTVNGDIHIRKGRP